MRKMKKLATIFLALFISLYCMPAVALAESGRLIGSGSIVLTAVSTDDTEIPPAATLGAQSGNAVASGTWGTCPWDLTVDGTLTVHPGEGGEAKIASQEVDGGFASYWHDYADEVVRVVFAQENGGKVIAPADSFGLLSYMHNMKSIDLSGLDTSKVEEMGCMFWYCTALTSVDLSCLDTSNAKSMRQLFTGCESLRNATLSGLSTSNVEDMNRMFFGCSTLESVDFTGIDTSNVSNMEYMFAYCGSLPSLDLTDFDTTSLVRMSNMFLCCTSLESLDLSSFDTSNVTAFFRTFEECKSLRSLDVSRFDTSSAVNMRWMFVGCSTLEELDISSFDTSNVTTMWGMFSGCTSLNELDLSSFDTSNVTNMRWMFASCSSLASLNISSFDVSKVEDMSGMFEGCPSLMTTVLGAGFGFKNGAQLPNGIWLGPVGRMSAINLAETYDGAIMAGMYTKVSVGEVSATTVGVIAPVTYNGTAQEPAVVVSDGEYTLVYGEDYALSYRGNVNAGTATVTVTGKGNYTGTKSTMFKILAADLSDASISGLSSQTYNGKPLTQAPVVKLGSKTLKSGTDYTISYSNNVKVGTATIIVAGKGSYTGKKSATFKIKKAKQPMTVEAIAKKVKAATAEKKAVAVKKAIIVKKNQGKVSYKNVSKTKNLKKFKVNAKNGTVTVPEGTIMETYKIKVKVTAKGNANFKSGSKTVTVKITVK